MIAAIAISNDLPIHTCNPRDFTGVDELTLVLSLTLTIDPHNSHRNTDARGADLARWSARGGGATDVLGADRVGDVVEWPRVVGDEPTSEAGRTKAAI